MIFGQERDPKRIPEVLEALRIAWEKSPQLRLMQLLVNVNDSRPNPLFNVEDDILLERLKRQE